MKSQRIFKTLFCLGQMNLGEEESIIRLLILIWLRRTHEKKKKKISRKNVTAQFNVFSTQVIICKYKSLGYLKYRFNQISIPFSIGDLHDR